ncbi:phospholipase A2-like isoform X1 [Stigmatopora nigra]
MMANHRILLLFTVGLAFVASEVALSSPRSKRSLIEMAGMMHCSTRRLPTAYLLYGCYCGLGGRGWPRDSTDWCCQRHDCCFAEAERLGCRPKIDRYKWTCNGRTPVCDDTADPRLKFLCECDREFAVCLRNSPYKRRYSFWRGLPCGSKEPQCTSA